MSDPEELVKKLKDAAATVEDETIKELLLEAANCLVDLDRECENYYYASIEDRD